MKLHLFHFTPHGIARAISHLRAGRMLCKKYGHKFTDYIPGSVNSMTAAWNYSETLVENNLTAPKTIIDVGANSSQMSCMLMMASDPDAELISFEPNPTLSPKGSRYYQALSSKDGHSELTIPHNDSGWGTIKPTDIDGPTIKVEVRSFDSLVASNQIELRNLKSPILVKIDTEGSEMDALIGFGKHLSLIDYLIVEVENSHHRGRNYNLLSMCNHLSSLGFTNSKILYSCYDGPYAPAYSDIMFWK